MRPTQTLDQALTDGDKALAPLLSAWLANEESRRKGGGKRPGPYEVRVGWQNPGEGRRTILELAWTPQQAIPSAAGGLMEKIKEKVEEIAGPTPVGKLRLMCYHAGESTEGFNTDRSVAPSFDDVGGDGSVDVHALRLQNTQLLNSVVGAMAHMATALTAATTLAAEATKTVATVATARTAGSAAADAGGLWGVVSLLAVAVTWPILQDTMGLKHATLPEMLRLFQSRVSGAIRGDQARGGVEELQLTGAPPAPPLELVDAEEVAPGPDAEALLALAKAKREPAYFKAVAAGIMKDPELRAAALEAMAA